MVPGRALEPATRRTATTTSGANEKPEEPPGAVAFPGEETSIWQHDRKAGAYYLHHFYRYQPDLNIANAAVRDEIAKIMGFWLHQGVSGFRVDAVPALLQVENRAEAPDFDPQAYLRELRTFMGRRRGRGDVAGRGQRRARRGAALPRRRARATS